MGTTHKVDDIYKDVFESDRNEIYSETPVDAEIYLPITRHGLGALVSRVCSEASLPCDDSATLLVCGYVHHIDRSTSTTTIKALVSALKKQYANTMTMMVIDEIDQKRRADQAASQEKAAPTLVPDPVEVPASNDSA